jgi:hypothetical protein
MLNLNGNPSKFEGNKEGNESNRKFLNDNKELLESTILELIKANNENELIEAIPNIEDYLHAMAIYLSNDFNALAKLALNQP